MKYAMQASVKWGQNTTQKVNLCTDKSKARHLFNSRVYSRVSCSCLSKSRYTPGHHSVWMVCTFKVRGLNQKSRLPPNVHVYLAIGINIHQSAVVFYSETTNLNNRTYHFCTVVSVPYLVWYDLMCSMITDASLEELHISRILFGITQTMRWDQPVSSCNHIANCEN